MSKPKIDFAVGGQAVIEGVMMRSPNHITVAVRKMDGSIKVQEKEFTPIANRIRLSKIPILRGIINMFEMIVVGTKALNFAAQEQIDDEEELDRRKKEAKKSGQEVANHSYQEELIKPSKIYKAEHKNEEKTKLGHAIDVALFSLSIVFALGLSIFLFKFVPFWSTTLISEHITTVNQNYILFNSIDGVIKISIFILYIGLLALLPSIKRVFEYHGAEHKAIMTYEQDLPLKVEHARKQTRFHPRCGTSFILIVFIISILVYTLFPRAENFWISFTQRVAILPLIAGISYEFLKFSAKHHESIIMKAFIKPGLWLQRLTTSEPDDTQLEVALIALEKALELEKTK